MKLYHYHTSSASYRVRLALMLKGINTEFELVDIRSGKHRQPEYLAKNPQGLVPFFVSDDGVRLGQSMAILEYLEEIAPTPSLYPADRADRALARSMAQQVACDVGPFQKTTLQNHLRARHHFDDQDIQEFVSHWMLRGLQPIEDFAKTRLDGDGLLFGRDPTVAECCIIPQLYNARLFSVDTSSLEALTELERRCFKLHVFQAAAPEAWR